MNSIDIFPWNENFNTSLKSIDEQHQRLAQLLNQLAGHLAHQTGLPALNHIFDELADYAVYHFQNEESIWHQYLPDDSMEKDHIEVHNHFISMVNTLRLEEKYKSSELVVEEILAFLTQWLASHILETDRHMAMVVLLMQSGMSLASAKLQAREQMGGTMKALIEIILSTYGNHVTNTLHLMREIAERRQTEDYLRESDARFRRILENAPIGMVTTSLDGHILIVNQAFCSMLGYERNELESMTFQAITHPEDRYLTLTGRQELLDGEVASYHMEKRYLRKDGQIVWVLLTSTLERNESGAPLYFIAQVENVTERKHTEDALRESELRFRSIFDKSPVPMWVVEEGSLRYLAVNDRTIEHYGYSREEFCRMTLRDIRPDAELAKFNTYFAGADNQNRAGEWIHRKKDGTNISVLINSVPIMYGDIPSRIVIVQDITARKQIEDSLHQQLIFSNALNKISRTLVEQENTNFILQGAVSIAGETLGADRALIYDVSFKKHHVIGLCQWLNPNFDDITSSMGTYSLDIFIDAASAIKESRSWLASHKNCINSHFLKDGSGEFLHNELNIQSLLWYPFAFRDNEYYLLVLNQTHTLKEWTKEEIGFLDSVSHLTSIALDKLKLMEERKQIVNDLRIAATSFEVQEGMMITDARNVILRVNQTFTDITGYTPDEIIGKKPSQLSSGRHDANFYSGMWNKLGQAGTWDGEIWNRRKNGEIYPEHLTITAVKDTKGNVTNYVAAFSDITQSKAAEEAIKDLAFFDPLTKLSNRRLLQDRLQQALSASDRSGQTGALLFIDLDNFKTINDTLGHAMGDVLLQEVAERLKSCVRQGDTVARLGGDEFVIMLEDLSVQAVEAAAQAEFIGDKILSSLNHPYKLGNKEYLNTPSIGIVLFNGHRQVTDDLFRQADIAMYQAKKDGRNALRFFDPKMQEAINSRSVMESELRNALELKQFQLYYQIQVDHERRPLGAEALIRWIHPERNLVSPSEFIPIAEDTGLILQIGQWVLDSACSQLKIWQQEAYTRELILSVNVSAKQFRQIDFAEQVQASLMRHDINPALLKLEITESVLLDDIESIIVTMNTLNKIGVRFSLDDFGTGYSSLQYLKRLPLHQLKIDQSFVRDLVDDINDRAIIFTIISMAHSLNLEVIAEGVETEEQRRYLEENGCNSYQGYLFGKPVPIEEFQDSLKSGFPLSSINDGPKEKSRLSDKY
jgi:diguanylate cyclase (GGDEF)-like protein/PAS domain S-box-containing protein/hemerythrin-like metal-binding protein